MSRLPHRKTLDEFDFDFQPGIDKTHLAVGLAMRALKPGMGVYYSSLSQLIADLKRAQEQNRLERRWRVCLRPDILIIDEVGYLQLGRTEAELLFRLVCERYGYWSIILTSNKFFSDWGELMSDTVIATALLDRLLRHAYVVNIRGDTYRLKVRRYPDPACAYPGGWLTAFWVILMSALTTRDSPLRILGNSLTRQAGNR